MEFFRMRAKTDPPSRNRLTPSALFQKIQRCLSSKYGDPVTLVSEGQTVDMAYFNEVYQGEFMHNETGRMTLLRYQLHERRAIVMTPVRDFRADLHAQPHILNALVWYAKLCNDGEIAHGDLVFVPLCQIANERKHFVLLFMMNEQLTVIDSKEASLFYPLSEFRDSLKSFLNKNPMFQLTLTEFKNLGHQSLFNDSDCGHHVLSYILQLAQMAHSLHSTAEINLVKYFVQDQYPSAMNQTSSELQVSIPRSERSPAEVHASDMQGTVAAVDSFNDLLDDSDDNDYRASVKHQI